MIKDATKYMYFNIDRKHFQTTEYKSEIIDLFQENWGIEKFKNLQAYTRTRQDIMNLNKSIQELKNNPTMFERLFYYPLKRTGNAEVLLFLLIRNSYLNPSNKVLADIIINNVNYEIKNCYTTTKYKSKEYYYSNFKLGGTVNIVGIMQRIENLFGVLKGSELAELRQLNNKDFLKIESDYREIVYNNYFKKNNLILIDKSGYIKYVGKIKKDDIFIDTITEGTIKPMIKAETKD